MRHRNCKPQKLTAKLKIQASQFLRIATLLLNSKKMLWFILKTCTFIFNFIFYKHIYSHNFKFKSCGTQTWLCQSKHFRGQPPAGCQTVSTTRHHKWSWDRMTHKQHNHTPHSKYTGARSEEMKMEKERCFFYLTQGKHMVNMSPWHQQDTLTFLK